MSDRKGSASILPNSSARILAPMPCGLQVRWHEELDSHVLYQNERMIAAHHNGFSCHNLAERMLAGNLERALSQFDYITDCGGKHYVTRDEFIALNHVITKTGGRDDKDCDIRERLKDEIRNQGIC